MFDILAHRLFIGSVQCLCASCLCILCFYSVFFHLLFLFIPPAYFFPLYPCMHPYVLHHPSPSVWRAPYLEGPICLAEHILSGGLSTRRALRLEGCFFVFLCFSLFLVSVAGSTFFSLPDGLRHLFRDHNPYSILHIPYSMLYVIYDLEGSNAVNPQVRNLFHVGKIYLPFCLVH